MANSYNKRLQPLMLTANANSQTLLSLTYNYGLGTNDNGNVLSITNNRDLNRSENFTYDALNRITFAWSTGALWGERFEIDPWANLNKIRACQSGDPCYGKPQGEYLNQMADGNNRFIGMSYDAAGNLLNDGGGARTYNAENQLATAAA